jgi:subtilisin family serine protease
MDPMMNGTLQATPPNGLFAAQQLAPQASLAICLARSARRLAVWSAVRSAIRDSASTFRGFPETGIPGWGQQLMKLDQLNPSFAGQGVKIGIVDSGCDNRHPQLGHVTRGIDFTNNGDKSSWTKDTISHGTHCAGIITGASNRLQGIRGFAPMAEVHALKVFPGGRFSDLIDALDQCIERELDGLL